MPEPTYQCGAPRAARTGGLTWHGKYHAVTPDSRRALCGIRVEPNSIPWEEQAEDFRCARCRTAEILARVRALDDHEAITIGGVNVWRDGVWWCQAGAGVQFSRSPEACGRKVRELIRYLRKETP